MTQLERTRRLARAFTQLENAREALRVAQADFELEFGPWAAGRCINRDQARRQLVSTGYLEPRMERR